jgi:RimJ/RimL family protein N-acetyltransferase
MIEVRVLSARDAAEFQRLRLEALRESPTAFSSSYEDERDRDVAKIAERISPDGLGVVFGAFEGGQLIGLAGFRREGGRKREHKGFIWGMYVTPTHRRRGVGRQLVESVLSHASSLPGLRRVNLGVNAANSQAIALYEATGFRSYGVERAFLIVDGVEQDEVHMSYVIARA